MKKELENKFIELLEANIKSEKQFRSEELHKVALSAFTQNSAELDKRLLSLSVGSVGFLLAFLINDYSFKNDFFYGFTFLVFLSAVSGFSFTIYLLLEILNLNNRYYQSIISFTIKDNLIENKLIKKINLLETKMKKFDKCARKIFIISILISAFFIIMITLNKNIVEYSENNINKNQKKEYNMSNQKKEDNITNIDNLTMSNESASGLFKASKVVKPNIEPNKSSEQNTSVAGSFSNSKQDSNNSSNKGN